MAEYIERESLLKVLDGFEPIVQGRHDGMGLVEHGVWAGMCEIVKDEPAADVAPVVHGRWEFIANEYCSTAHCSNCGKGQGLYINGRKPDWNYCPNCGARMDGGNGDE